MGKHGKPAKCSLCNGEGKHVYNVDNKTEERQCSACKGTGKV